MKRLIVRFICVPAISLPIAHTEYDILSPTAILDKEAIDTQITFTHQKASYDFTAREDHGSGKIKRDYASLGFKYGLGSEWDVGLSGWYQFSNTQTIDIPINDYQ
jgi:hypothetical protein